MNERIQELAQNAGLISHFNSAPHRPDIEHFVKLIVQECCQFEKTYAGDAGLVARHFSRKIKEHFGVEE